MISEMNRYSIATWTQNNLLRMVKWVQSGNTGDSMYHGLFDKMH